MHICQNNYSFQYYTFKMPICISCMMPPVINRSRRTFIGVTAAGHHGLSLDLSRSKVRTLESAEKLKRAPFFVCCCRWDLLVVYGAHQQIELEITCLRKKCSVQLITGRLSKRYKGTTRKGSSSTYVIIRRMWENYLKCDDKRLELWLGLLTHTTSHLVSSYHKMICCVD